MPKITPIICPIKWYFSANTHRCLCTPKNGDITILYIRFYPPKNGVKAVTDYTENSGWCGLHSLSHECEDYMVRPEEDLTEESEITPFHVIEQMMNQYPMEGLRKDKSHHTPISWAVQG